MTELILKEEVYEVVGAALEVYYRLGPGFLEPIYQEALEMELRQRRIPFKAQDWLFVHYKGRRLEKKYKPDLICFGQIVAELKACDRLISRDVAQLLNYMKATHMRVGLLINFGASVKLEWKRYVL